METTIGNQLAQMRTSSQRTPQVSSDAVAAFIERQGWTRAVAGDEDFDTVVEAVTTAHAKRRGLFISGKPGVGKTSLLKSLARNYKDSVFLYCKSNDDLMYMRDTSNFNTNVGSVFISSNIGLSQQWEKDANGNRVRPISPEGVNERYGGRVLARILEMCVCFQMKGKSKRERIIL